MARIRGFAFDLEGTVVNVEAAHHLAHLKVAAELGLSLSVDQAIREVPHFIGGPDTLVLEYLWQLARSPSQTTLAELLARKRGHYRQNLESLEISPRPGFLAFLRLIRDDRCCASIGSATPREEAEILLQRSGLKNLFGPSKIILLEDVREPKPAPEVYLLTALRMNLSSSAQLVFEDSSRGVRAGVAAGSPVVGMPVYSHPAAVIPLIQAGARRVFWDWLEMNPQQLLANLEREST